MGGCVSPLIILKEQPHPRSCWAENYNYLLNEIQAKSEHYLFSNSRSAIPITFNFFVNNRQERKEAQQGK
jgi:hypothetical protein